MHREELLEWLKEYMIDNPISMNKLAKEVGISTITLTKFYRGNTLHLKQLLRIEKFLKDRE